MGVIISGIQQVGIGVADAEKAWKWYRKCFGMDVPIFKDAATASLMTRYTAGIAEKRFAILAMNMQGGGGFEIWQYTSKVPQPPAFDLMLGDTGVFAVKIKAANVRDVYNDLKKKDVIFLSELVLSPDGHDHFYVQDPHGNLFEVTAGKSWFKNSGSLTGGVGGCVIGVSDMDKSLSFYNNVLGYTTVLYDQTGSFEDLSGLNGGDHSFRRVLLSSPPEMKGAFGRLLGSTEVELIEVKERAPKKIFENRNWGDLGYIHLCFDINGMADLELRCKEQGFPFTIDSRDSFDMGKAAGHFAYCEDPDGTWIEFVETHRIPIFEKLGWYLNLRKRNPEKPLPNWMLGMLSLNRVKD